VPTNHDVFKQSIYAGGSSRKSPQNIVIVKLPCFGWAFSNKFTTLLRYTNRHLPTTQWLLMEGSEAANDPTQSVEVLVDIDSFCAKSLPTAGWRW